MAPTHHPTSDAMDVDTQTLGQKQEPCIICSKPDRIANLEKFVQNNVYYHDACLHPTEPEASESKEQCVICRDNDSVANLVSLQCDHFYHLRCLVPWWEHRMVAIGSPAETQTQLQPPPALVHPPIFHHAGQFPSQEQATHFLPPHVPIPVFFGPEDIEDAAAFGLLLQQQPAHLPVPPALPLPPPPVPHLTFDAMENPNQNPFLASFLQRRYRTRNIEPNCCYCTQVTTSFTCAAACGHKTTVELSKTSMMELTEMAAQTESEPKGDATVLCYTCRIGRFLKRWIDASPILLRDMLSPEDQEEYDNITFVPPVGAHHGEWLRACLKAGEMAKAMIAWIVDNRFLHQFAPNKKIFESLEQKLSVRSRFSLGTPQAEDMADEVAALWQELDLMLARYKDCHARAEAENPVNRYDLHKDDSYEWLEYAKETEPRGEAHRICHAFQMLWPRIADLQKVVDVQPVATGRNVVFRWSSSAEGLTQEDWLLLG
ncbi:uncharacterized protein BCR38DRAFT_26752 [Pseudomassariella vexata]|uniref:RING-type domain-containing protein n=1 Tax=Pseudomassariella vexata TaxID=1141098 RepID=A0A1Y2EKK3_9PEZI|nr:uncharacterized protein BCR38DRAFT_26752 [Pseudomassariella vexata]ORY72072.1 hypothetical protein BCR38DRAFT_26752 [Pseudomassariella vexata]